MGQRGPPLDHFPRWAPGRGYPLSQIALVLRFPSLLFVPTVPLLCPMF